MQIVSCPSCGAEVTFRSHASVMAVCEYCNTSVLKDADSVKDMGKMSAVLEDYSPIQINTSGVLGGRQFTVVGRIQLQYSAGMWNEWYLLFDDGSGGWLGDSSGQFVVTTVREASGPLPSFPSLSPGNSTTVDGRRYTVAEVRNAQCIGGQGELPFRVGDGWRAQVADLRDGGSFATLDYSDGEVPTVYTGVSVTLESMQCQLLRDDEEIRRTTGRHRGKLTALDCPSCGSPIKYLPGLTSALLCPSCHAQLDAASPKVEVLRAGERLEAMRPSLELGAMARKNGQELRVTGFMVREDDEGTRWNEYLLYANRSGFSWLVETDDGWYRANVMSEWPNWEGGDYARLDKASFRKLYSYGARVVYAAGAFNWRVQAGDTVHVTEFEQGQVKLAAELSSEELTWSRSTPVPYDQLKALFGASLRGKEPKPKTRAGNPKSFAKKAIMVMLALNLVPIVLSFGGAFFYNLIGALAIFLPALFIESQGKDK